jgi:hypothetical protein
MGAGNPAAVSSIFVAGFSLGADVKNSISFMSRPRKAMSKWVVHCEVNRRHIATIISSVALPQADRAAGRR